jgi:23S rRNA (guanosine2251-2'-O)-methyltransferase
MAELGRVSVEHYHELPKAPVTIVLDNLRSLHNVGSAFRTADAFSLEKIFLTGITGKPPHREIEKTALGATLSVAWEYVESPEAAVAELKSAGYHIAVVEQTDASTPLDKFHFPSTGKLCLVFGNEVNGVSEPVINLADTAIEIPQSGTKHSLNVSVCIGIIAWSVTRQLPAT